MAQITRKPLQFMGSSHDDLRCLIYLATRPEAVYVLHCFQKKTEKTSQHDIDLAKRRLKAIPKAPR